jgi:hypothetical protein
MTRHNDDDRHADRPPHGDVTETPPREGRPDERAPPEPRHDDEPNDLGLRSTHGHPSDPLVDLLGSKRLRDEIEQAVEAVRSDTVEMEGITVPATPDANDARVLLSAQQLPVTVGARRIERLGVQEGQPRHGAMPSHTHVDRFRVAWNAPAEDCPECGRQRRVRDMSRHGNESVHDVVLCGSCGHELAVTDF